MVYVKVIHLLDNLTNQPFGSETKNWVEANIYKSFKNCISALKNKQVDNAKDLFVIMSMYNLLE